MKGNLLLMKAKGYVPNQSEEVFVIKKLKNTAPWTHVISILKDEEIDGTLWEKTFRKGFRVEKVLKRKGDKLQIKWRGYDSSFNRWID